MGLVQLGVLKLRTQFFVHLKNFKSQNKTPKISNKSTQHWLQECIKLSATVGKDPLPCYVMVFDNDYFWT